MSNRSVPKRLKRNRAMATPHSQKRCNPNPVSPGIRSTSHTSGTAVRAHLKANLCSMLDTYMGMDRALFSYSAFILSVFLHVFSKLTDTDQHLEKGTYEP